MSPKEPEDDKPDFFDRLADENEAKGHRKKAKIQRTHANSLRREMGIPLVDYTKRRRERNRMQKAI